MKNRKWLTGVLCLVLLASVIWGGSPTFAAWQWCSSDPVFEINGETVEVIIDLAPYEIKDQITDENPVRVTLTVPNGVEAELKSVSGDFPEEVTIIQRGEGSKMKMDVDVPNLPDLERVRVTVVSEGQILASGENGAPHVTVNAPIPGDD